MIQRIQTIFLLLGAAACFGLFALPFATAPAAAQVEEGLFADGMFNIQDNIALVLFFSLSGLLALIGIFQYGRRQLQMRLTIFALIAVVIGIALGLIFTMQQNAAIPDAATEQAGLALPPLAIIFFLLAYRFINKDEKLVRSMDRLR